MAHICKRPLGCPTEHLSSELGASFQSWYVARPALDNFVWISDACGVFEALYYIKHTQALACPEVEGEGCWWIRLKEMFDGCGVSFRQIHHMQIVADACPVGCGVVVAKHA